MDGHDLLKSQFPEIWVGCAYAPELIIRLIEQDFKGTIASVALYLSGPNTSAEIKKAFDRQLYVFDNMGMYMAAQTYAAYMPDYEHGKDKLIYLALYTLKAPANPFRSPGAQTKAAIRSAADDSEYE